MSLFISSLNSGSSGNCYYIGNEREAVLIDAGISCREIEKRMTRLNLNIHKVKAVFISHEHSDHINGLQVLAKKYQLPVYTTQEILRHGKLQIENHLVIFFNAHDVIPIGNLSITAFPKFHDAADPYSFVVSFNEIKVGVFTDIGVVCKNLINHFQQCHAAFLESNYDDTMLEKGRYPLFLKNRIRGGMGHLSNKQALELFNVYRPSFMTHLFLSHLSENNNTPELVAEVFNQHANGVKMIVTSRYQETDVYQIGNTPSPHLPLKKRMIISSQLSFEFT